MRHMNDIKKAEATPGFKDSTLKSPANKILEKYRAGKIKGIRYLG